jgi:DNA replication protein DnaD
MKKGIFSVLAMLLMLSVFAQKQGPNPEQRAKKMTEHMKTNLSLTDEQTKAVELINLDFARAKVDMEKGNHEANVALKNDFEKELAAVLTPEQVEKMKEMRKEQKGKHMHKGAPKE